MFSKGKGKVVVESDIKQKFPKFGTEDVFAATGDYDVTVDAILGNFDKIIALEITGEEIPLYTLRPSAVARFTSQSRKSTVMSHVSRIFKPKISELQMLANNPIAHEYLSATIPQSTRNLCGAFKEIVQKIWLAQRAIEKQELHDAETRPFNLILYEAQE